jgi:Domain of unknown function (DUF4350)
MAQKRKAKQGSTSEKFDPSRGLRNLRSKVAMALPYFTRTGGDCEYIFSNPTATPIGTDLIVFGKECSIAKRFEATIKPHCSKSYQIRPIVPDHAGHSVLISTGQLIAHILYMNKGLIVTGGELVGNDNLFQWRENEKSRTYGFGYRTSPLGNDSMSASIFVSNPSNLMLTGSVNFFDARCEMADRRKFRIKPWCTIELKCPANTYGFGRITISHKAVMNVLHFSKVMKGLTAAELLGEINQIDMSVDPPQPRTKVLFDNTHQCRPGAVGDWATFAQELSNAGMTVSHHNSGTITASVLNQYHALVIAMARVSYTQSEKDAIVNFVNQGGGLLISQDFGNAPWSAPTREILNLFGANDDNNTAEDPTNNDNSNFTNIVFDSSRNFYAHPITIGLSDFSVSATATLSGAGGWNTVVETDDDSTPVRSPVLIARAFGQGRVVALGDSNIWADHMIGVRQNKDLGISCIKWILFSI